jgi:hypothetical protein
MAKLAAATPLGPTYGLWNKLYIYVYFCVNQVKNQQDKEEGVKPQNTIVMCKEKKWKAVPSLNTGT